MERSDLSLPPDGKRRRKGGGGASSPLLTRRSLPSGGLTLFQTPAHLSVEIPETPAEILPASRETLGEIDGPVSSPVESSSSTSSSPSFIVVGRRPSSSKRGTTFSVDGDVTVLETHDGSALSEVLQQCWESAQTCADRGSPPPLKADFAVAHQGAQTVFTPTALLNFKPVCGAYLRPHPRAASVPETFLCSTEGVMVGDIRRPSTATGGALAVLFD